MLLIGKYIHCTFLLYLQQPKTPLFKKCKVNFKVANEIVKDGNKQLQDALSKSKLDQNKIQQAQTKIETGLEQKKKKIENELHSLQQK